MLTKESTTASPQLPEGGETFKDPCILNFRRSFTFRILKFYAIIPSVAAASTFLKRKHAAAKQYVCSDSDHALWLGHVFPHHHTFGTHLFVFVSRCPFLNRPVQLPLILHA